MVGIVDAIKSGDVVRIKAVMAEHDLVLDGQRIVPRNPEAKQNLAALATFWDQRQQAR